jgi:transposase
LTRTRKQLVRERASHAQRIDKILQDANIKLGSVLSDIMGESGQWILNALSLGETDPERLASLVSVRVRASRQSLMEALRGTPTRSHRFLLRLHLRQYESLSLAIDAVDAEVGCALEPLRDAANRLTTAPGISEVASAAIVSEIGADMTRFPSAAHLISWAGLCPRNDESAGKRRSTRLRHGAPWLKTLLVQSAWCATRAKGTYLRAQFLRLKGRRGPRKAIVAVAASLLTAIYHMLKNNKDYADLGADHFDRTNRPRTAKRLVRRLQDLGFQVELRDGREAVSS